MTWTPDEIRRRGELEASRAVVVDSHKGKDENLRAWAKARGLLVYIGRADRFGRWSASEWGNPFTSGTHAERVARYRGEHLPTRPDLLARLPELKGKALACWCAPLACHGDVLAELANALDGPPGD